MLRSPTDPLLRRWEPPLRVARGHFATLAPFFVRRFRPPVGPPTVAWELEVSAGATRRVRLTGRFRRRESADLLVVLHGLGGSVSSGYMTLALREAERAGMSCLLLNARGADGSGEDIYHAGLYSDLARAVESLPEFERVFVLGYSLGGHVALRYAASNHEARVSAVAAICAPLDLELSAAAFDRSRFNLYRKHVLDALLLAYAAVAKRHHEGISPTEASRIRRIREWDDRVVAPRFGFEGAEAYYRSESAGPRLRNLAKRALYVGASADPMVPRAAVEDSLAAASEHLRVHWCPRGGHLGFASRFDLGERAPLGLESQVLAWMRRGGDVRP